MKREKKAKAGDAGIHDLANILAILPLIPLMLVTLLSGKALRPLLSELTGLSPSHLRRGKNSKLRETTEHRALETAKHWISNNLTEKDWSEAEINSHMETSPSNVIGEPRPYADFIHSLQIPGEYELPRTIAFAEEIDKIVIRLLDAHKADDLEEFKQAIIDCNWGDGIPHLIADRQADGQQLESLRAASDWDAVLPTVEKVFFNILFYYFAALDAEYGLIYFNKFQVRPLFSLVMPKMNPQTNLGSLDKLPRRNLVYQPVRRLLELSHALMVWIRDERWPDKPVGRKELGEALDLTDQYIGNFFDGTRNMHAKLFGGFWMKMCQTVARCKPFPPPWPLALAAMYWQSTITRQPNQKLGSFILFDEVSYTSYWTWHHQRWASQLNNGTVGWPAWLGDQPS